MSAADPHTDDLAAFLSEQADSYARLASDTYGRPHDAVRAELLDTESKFRAAAAELRRLRHRDAALTDQRDEARRQMQSLTEDYVRMEERAVRAEAALTTLLDAAGDPELLRHWSNWHAAECVDMHGLVAGHDGCCVEASRAHHLRRIAAAVEGIDQEHER